MSIKDSPTEETALATSNDGETVEAFVRGFKAVWPWTKRRKTKTNRTR